ncbi:MAG: hypothetical protein ACXWLR_00310 [Myxococcales bacterium]
MAQSTFEKVAPGVFVVRYQTDEDLLPDRQDALLAAVRAERGGAAIVFVLAPDVWKVDLSVPQFWAKTVADPAIPLRAIAVVSASVAVRAATHTFRIATMLRRQHLAVASLDAEGPAVEWVRNILRAPAAASP